MYKTEAGFLFCEIQTQDGDEEDVFTEWEWTKAGFDLDIVTAFWDMGDESIKVITCDGDIYCVNIPYNIFCNVISKHRNTFRKVIN